MQQRTIYRVTIYPGAGIMELFLDAPPTPAAVEAAIQASERYAQDPALFTATLARVRAGKFGHQQETLFSIAGN